MARIKQESDGSIRINLSANDTYDWAHRTGKAWPCSQLSGRRVFAEFDSRGDLVDLAIDGGKGEQDVDGNEFAACASDFITAKFPDSPAIR